MLAFDKFINDFTIEHSPDTYTLEKFRSLITYKDTSVDADAGQLLVICHQGDAVACQILLETGRPSMVITDDLVSPC